MKDPLFSDLESAERLLRGTAKQASEGAEQITSSIDDLVQANDQLWSILSDVVDRLIEAEAKIAALEAT